ncbi:hypothetical protein DL93DRAFT_1565187 [Clavulina sp. PMI_390]|nr:hypothetical protein DL93DRAFT_1565187 [Clavulina sp. PMI_390]
MPGESGQNQSGSTMPAFRISQLPPELFTEVLKALVDEYSIFKVFRPLLTITSVSTHWRAVAITSPVLWTQIHYGPGPAHQKDRAGEKNIVAAHKWAMTCLERSRSAPFDVVLESIYFDPETHGSVNRDGKTQHWWKAIELFAPHLSRCRFLNLRSMHVDARRLWSTLRLVEFRLLREFWFDGVGDENFGLPNTIFSTARGDIHEHRMICPTLTEVEIISHERQTLRPIPIAPALRKLHLVVSATGQWWDNLVASLPELPLLDHLTIMFVGPSLSLGWDLERRVEVPNLEYLETNFPPFSVNLRTPRLTQLMLRGLHLDRWSDITQTEAYRRHLWPHPTLDPHMSAIQSLSQLSIVNCEIELSTIGENGNLQEWLHGGEVLNKMMLSMGKISIDTLEFINCRDIEGTLRRLGSPLDRIAPSLGNTSSGGTHNPADDQTTRNLSYLLPNLRRLVMTECELEDSANERFGTKEMMNDHGYLRFSTSSFNSTRRYIGALNLGCFRSG